MTTAARVLRGRYVDSVVLMRLAQALSRLAGVADAAAMMGTPANKQLLAEGGFLVGDADSARADDLIVAVKGDSAEAALERVDELLVAPATDDAPVRSLDEALRRESDLNLAAISLPGEYAAGQAHEALARGLHVFVFSSNVELADEIALKELARERGLLCMGPDCGTAIVAGVGLGFANAVRRGPVGVVGASGTGIQVVTSLLDRWGVGVSHALGCGSRDLSEPVGGLTARAALAALATDAGTSAVLVLSKPSAASVVAELRALAQAIPKPVVFCFLGDDVGPQTLDEAARDVASAAGVDVPESEPVDVDVEPARGRKLLRGLYAGGTLAYEAQLVLRRAGLEVASNAPLPGGRLYDGTGTAILDLGSEEFTRGRPHPMIDARERRAHLRAAAESADVGVVLLDLVLGYGAARDPAGDLAAEIAAARAAGLVVLASVCGTDRDPQGLSTQVETLRRAGAIVFESNSAATRAAATLVGAPVLAR